MSFFKLIRKKAINESEGWVRGILLMQTGNHNAIIVKKLYKKAEKVKPIRNKKLFPHVF